MRSLQRLSLAFSTLRAVCEQPRAMPAIRAVTVAIRGCPPARWQPVVVGEALPGLRQLTVVHRSGRGGEDWSWLIEPSRLASLTVDTAGGWYGDELRALAEELRFHFGAIARLPRVVV